jgi:phosphoribosylformylglycinamidine cyclo-ligase
MRRTFNNGIGLILVVPEESSQEVLDRMSAMDEKAYFIGEITSRNVNENQIEWI